MFNDRSDYRIQHETTDEIQVSRNDECCLLRISHRSESCFILLKELISNEKSSADDGLHSEVIEYT